MDGAAFFVSIWSRTVWCASGRGLGSCFGFITSSPPNGAHSFKLNRSGLGKVFRDQLSDTGQVPHCRRWEFQCFDFWQRPNFRFVSKGAAEPVIFPAGDAELVADGAYGGQFLGDFSREPLLQEPNVNRDSFLTIFWKNLRATNGHNFSCGAHESVHVIAQPGF